MSDPWDPPADHSGGYFIAQYTNGVYTHRSRVHVDVFNVLTLNYSVAHGSESSVGQTIANFFNQWKVFYTNAWTISLLSLWAMESGIPVEIAIPPTVTPVVGTNGGAEAASPAGEQIWNLKTTNGGRARIIQVANALWSPAAPAIYTSASAGAPGAFMTYLSGVNCAIVGHDGGSLLNMAKVTTPINRRLRRHYRLD